MISKRRIERLKSKIPKTTGYDSQWWLKNYPHLSEGYIKILGNLKNKSTAELKAGILSWTPQRAAQVFLGISKKFGFDLDQILSFFPEDFSEKVKAVSNNDFKT